jgi:hypothetical protein
MPSRAVRSLVRAIERKINARYRQALNVTDGGLMFYGPDATDPRQRASLPRDHSMTYRAPVADIAFALKKAADFGPALAGGLYGDLADDLVEAVLTEAGKFATDILSPLNAIGSQRSPETRGDSANPRFPRRCHAAAPHDYRQPSILPWKIAPAH